MNASIMKRISVFSFLHTISILRVTPFDTTNNTLISLLTPITLSSQTMYTLALKS